MGTFLGVKVIGLWALAAGCGLETAETLNPFTALQKQVSQHPSFRLRVLDPVSSQSTKKP